MNTRNFCSIAAMALSALLAACGGGSDAQVAGINGSGVTGTGSPGVAVGPITGFGSIFVNGVEFELSNSTSVSVDGVPSSGQADLRVGQVVTVNGTINTATGKGTATSVAFNDNLQGAVVSKDITASTFLVFGQTVLVTGATTFEGTTDLSTLAVGAVVEVSGFVNAAGQIEATRVEVKTGAGESELTGTVSGLSGSTFSLGTTLINFASANLRDGSPANGACVEVKGSFTADVFVATSVEVKSCGITATAGLGEIEGIITTGLSGGSFVLGVTNVSITSSPTYVNGVQADLVAGKKVEVEGTFNSSGVLVASKIEFKQGTGTRLTGFVDTVDTTTKTVTMFGIPVTITASTQMVDKLGSSNATFALSNIQNGNYLEVRGYENAAHTAMTAVTLERRAASSSNRLELRAFPQFLVQPSFKLMAATVNTTQGSEFRDLSGNSVTQTQFFTAAAAPNVMVKVRGANQAAWNATVGLDAEKAELESP